MRQMWVWLVIVVALVTGCGNSGPGNNGVSPGQPGAPPEGFLEGPDQILAEGVVGVPYESAAMVSGGTPPYTWSVDEGVTLPGGLELTPSGLLTGIPTQAGEHTFAVEARDADGRTKRLLLTITVRLDPILVGCGEVITGTFRGNATGFGGPQFDELESLAWIGVQVPPAEDNIQTITLDFLTDAAGIAYVQRPSEELGSWNIEDEYVPFGVNPPFTSGRVRLDASTIPSLSGYLAQPLIPVLWVGQEQGTWSLEVQCSDDPVFVQLPQFPTELGQEIEIDYDVYGPNEGVRIYTPDPLPEWIQWNEETGEVTGTAEEPGAWEITVIAETTDGRRTEGRSIIGVFEVLEAACNTFIPVVTQQSFFDGEWTNYWDPRGYRVYRLPLDGTVSQIDMRLTNFGSNYLGYTNPDPGWLKFFPGAERTFGGGTSRLVLEPRSQPSLGSYVNEGEIYIVAASTTDAAPLELTLTCDTGPRPDFAVLPVAEPFVEADFTLRGIGGTPPYTFSISGLPDGLRVRNDQIVGTTGDVGATSAVVTIEDANGLTSQYGYPFFVGFEEACSDAQYIECGETVEGRFTASSFADGNGPASTRAFCAVDRDLQPQGWLITSDGGSVRVDVGDPGVSVNQMWTSDRFTFATLVEDGTSGGVGVDPFTSPPLDDYENAAVRLGLRAQNPGDWSVTLTCP